MQSQKGVLLVGNFLSAVRGQRFVCEDLADRLELAGWNVFRTSSEARPLPRLLDVVRTTWGQRHSYQVAQVDVFSGSAFVWAEAACSVLRLARKPYVLALRGGNLPEFAARWSWRVRRMFNAAAVVTTPSRYLLEQMAPYCADMRLLPNPLNLSNYAFRPRDQVRPELVWLRAFHPVYNPELAPRVLARLLPDMPDVRLTMVGPEREAGSLQRVKEVAAQEGVAERITFQGSVPKIDVPNWMHQGDIYLNTTNIDNTPVTVMEAMACGLCVICTRVGGITYLLEDEHDALLVPPDDPEAMAAAVRRILCEPGLAGRLSRNGRSKVEAFDWAAILHEWETVLTAAAKRDDQHRGGKSAL